MKFLQFLKNLFLKKFWIKLICLALALFVTIFLCI